MVNPDIWKGIRNLTLGCAAGLASGMCIMLSSQSLRPAGLGGTSVSVYSPELGKGLWCLEVKAPLYSVLFIHRPCREKFLIERR